MGERRLVVWIRERAGRRVLVGVLLAALTSACTSPPPDGGGPTSTTSSNTTSSTTTTPSTTTTLPPGGSGVAESLAVGRFHNCLLVDDGSVRCWGSNSVGQLGTGASGSSTAVPQTVPGIATAVQIAAGDEHTCALLGDGTVSCWGGNALSQLGNGAIGGASAVPQPVAGLTDVVAIDAGTAHTCVAHASGAASCWGANDSLQAGGSTSPARTPSAVADVDAAVGVSAGVSHSCAVLGDGRVRCWGSNGARELGSWVPGPSGSAVVVPDLPAVQQVSAGDAFTCALASGATTWCWGSNGRGQLAANPGWDPVVVGVWWVG